MSTRHREFINWDSKTGDINGLNHQALFLSFGILNIKHGKEKSIIDDFGSYNLHLYALCCVLLFHKVDKGQAMLN